MHVISFLYFGDLGRIALLVVWLFYLGHDGAYSMISQLESGMQPFVDKVSHDVEAALYLTDTS